MEEWFNRGSFIEWYKSFFQKWSSNWWNDPYVKCITICSILFTWVNMDQKYVAEWRNNRNPKRRAIKNEKWAVSDWKDHQPELMNYANISLTCTVIFVIVGHSNELKYFATFNEPVVLILWSNSWLYDHNNAVVQSYFSKFNLKNYIVKLA